MKLTKKVIVAATGLLFATALQVKAQTADEVISKNIEAMGGKDKLNSIRTLYIEATAVTQNGMEISTKTWKVKDKLYRQEINFGMGSVETIVTPSKGWAASPRSNGEFKPMTDEQLKMSQGQMDPAGPFVDYASKGGKAELDGKDTVNGKECYKVKLTNAAGQEVVYSIDEQTYYILRETRKMPAGMGGGGMGGGQPGGGAGGGRRGGGDASGDGRSGNFKMEFSDYQKTPEGYIFPYTIVAGGFGAKSSIEKIEINKPVDESSLAKPGN